MFGTDVDLDGSLLIFYISRSGAKVNVKEVWKCAFSGPIWVVELRYVSDQDQGGSGKVLSACTILKYILFVLIIYSRTRLREVYKTSQVVQRTERQSSTSQRGRRVSFQSNRK